ncbi:hypothetical protein AFE02nite_02540 [Actinotalea fermentans]|uniref:Xaa-Pro dipeptidyl-peptidase-like domain-containing protein n=1 Tax=Actinotalea fermentans TaxID=43671 RepID=A0A511YTJ9_9CELL|nr:hypothetical protein AFE02nite_02540 [Actinotalea fermentans]
MAAVAVAVGGAVVVGLSGSPLWGAVRAALVLAVGALVAGVLRRAAVRPAGWSAVGVGALVLPAAGVIAGGHLVGGAVLRGGAALVASLGALVLLVLGTVWLLRAAHGWWRLLALPVAVVVVQLVWAPLGQAVLVTNREPAALGDATPADHGLAAEDVTLTTSDGIDLAAWWVPPENGAAVLLLHGSGSTRTATLDHAEVLAAAGFGVLMVDARGHGASDGTAMDLGWHGARDLAAAVTWLADRPDVEEGRIGAVGLSMGGEEALTLAGEDPRVRAVVGDGVGIRVAGDVPSPAPFEDAINRLTYAVTDLLTAASPPRPLREVVAGLAAEQRVLLVAAAGEGDQAAWYAAAAPGRVEVWDVPDVAHTRALDEHPQEWATRVVGFLEDALAG